MKGLEYDMEWTGIVLRWDGNKIRGDVTMMDGMGS